MAQAVKNLPANAGDVSLIPGLRRSSRGENDNPLQYSCLGNFMDRVAWHATVHRVENSQTRWNMYMHKLVFSIDFRIFI